MVSTGPCMNHSLLQRKNKKKDRYDLLSVFISQLFNLSPLTEQDTAAAMSFVQDSLFLQIGFLLYPLFLFYELS